ncbi:MAG: hypothetical protein GEV05_18145 [Betaproteobacteria bacterium]|nr:hypothetical protein [Betaproteobacteria bacterium]
MRAKLLAEFIGTFWLVLGGCGSAVLAAAFPEVGIGLLGVSLAFGLTVLTGVYALGPISGGHFNPAVSVGLWAGGRFPAGQLLPYIIVQVLGGIVGAGVLYLIASGKADFSLAGGWALQQLWLFWIAPIIGAAIAGFTFKALLEGERLQPPVTGRTETATP